MHVVAIQPDIAWQDKPANFENVRRLVAAANAPRGALLVLPEMFATGFSMDVPAIAEEPGGPTEQFLLQLASDTGCAVAGGLVTRAPDGRGQNCLLVASPDGPIGRYQKVHPFSFAGEHEYYQPGSVLWTFRWGGLTIAPLVCYDLRFPEAFRALVAAGVEMFLVPANWPAERALHWRVLLAARAIENQAVVVGVNRVGSDPNVAYSGGSAIINGRGEPFAVADDTEGTIAAEIDARKLRACRERFGALADIRSDLLNPTVRIEHYEH